ncbi:MAG: zinc-dependent alcohol dehydrogenase family protein [Actinomycetota bacterium]
MRAALIDRFDADVPVVEVPDPICPEDGVVVSVDACGVCRSDHHAWKGVDPDVVLPHVMGHELAGEVDEVGPACGRFRVGQRVTVPFILGCGRCADCKAGRATVCGSQQVIGFTIWGAFAERIAIPHADANLVALPDEIDAVAAAALGCRVTTAWRALTDRGALQAGEWLVVHGAGGVGLSAIMLADALGARTIAVDVSADALDAARRLGAAGVVDAGSVDNVGAAVRELTDGGAHVSVDALGITTTFDNSLRSLRRLGRHVQVGMPVGDHATVSLPLLELIYARQLSLHGMRGLDAGGFSSLLGLVAAGRFDPARLVGRTIGLSGAEAALREMDGTPPPGITVIDDLTG